MDPTLFLFLMIIGMLLIGAPVAVSLGLSSIVFLLIYSDTSLGSIAGKLFEAMAEHQTLLAIPFFILASSFMSTGGTARRIIDFSIAAVGHLRGGLGIAGVFACMMFAALSGSSPATVVAIGSIAIAAMVRAGYSKEFAAGVICNAGTLGILIPPSIVMVVYASSVDVSVGRMFLAGIIPGLIAGLLLMVGIYIKARYDDMPAGDFVGWREVGRAARGAFWGLMLIAVIFIGIYGFPGFLVKGVAQVYGLISGVGTPNWRGGAIFTPTEAAAVASIYAAIVALFVYRDMGPFKDGLPAGVGMAAWMLLLIVPALAIAHQIHGAPEGARRASTMDWSASVPTAAIITVGGGLLLWILTNLSRLRGIGWEILMTPVGVIRALGAFGHKDARKTLYEAGKMTAMLMFIIANALILKHVLTEQRIPQQLTEMIVAAGLDWITFLIVVNVLLLIGGQFMEPSGLIVIIAPLVFPIAMELGIDPIHLGIIMVVNMEIGMITPPVGLNLFVTSGVAGMSVMAVVRAALPWLMILVVFLVIVTYVPWLSTVIPNAAMGPEIVTLP